MKGLVLAEYTPAAEPNFQWGSLKGEEFRSIIRLAYDEVVHWRRNIFLLPSGKFGKEFIRVLTSLFTAYSQGSALESVALEAIMVACVLLLQKPHSKSKSKDHVRTLERRLRAWHGGEIEGLMKEGRTLQYQLHPFARGSSHDQKEHTARVFSKLVFEGKIHSAIRFLSDSHGGGVLDLSADMDGRTVFEVLQEKHPPAGEVNIEALVSTLEPPDVHPMMFEQITGRSIRNAALRTQGTAGPSGVDAVGWRRICTAFHKESSGLCDAIAAVARRLCAEYVDPEPLRAFLACRLIPLDKRPGVRPIGVCEVVRRIMGKAIMEVVKKDVVNATGPIQLCAGHEGGAEAAVHAMRALFDDSATDAIMFVDASNAFNRLNRRVALHNIQ